MLSELLSCVSGMECVLSELLSCVSGLECVLSELLGRSRWRRVRHQLGAADAADAPCSPPVDWQPPADGAASGPCLCAAPAPAPAPGPTDATAASSADLCPPSESASRRSNQVSEALLWATRPRAAAAAARPAQVRARRGPTPMALCRLGASGRSQWCFPAREVTDVIFAVFPCARGFRDCAICDA